ncbi:MAG TPA: peptide ABC transporter substrate-binding protein, partial [Niallia sp.]|nr:peptide ABC transporter substrate-binding protein [Niallia sp.]
MKKHNILLLLLLLALSLVLAACNFGGETSTEETDGTETEGTAEEGPKEISLVVASEPPSLHPQL